MPETIQNGKWHWYNVMHDLKEQGGLKDVVVDPLSVTAHGCGGTLNGNKFSITWVKDKFLLVSMERHSDKLIKAFAAVLGYQPFCRYVHKKHGLPTVEWDKADPDSRYAELNNDPEVKQLRKV